MKALPFLLTVSLAVNAALVAWLGSPRAASSGARADHVTSVVGSAVAANAGELNAKVGGGSAAVASSMSWQKLDSADLDELLRRLRAAGFSPWEVRAIMSEKIAEKYPYRRPLEQGVPYWRSPNRLVFDPKTRAEETKLWAERDEAFRKYVVNLDDSPEALEVPRLQFGNLSPEKLRAMRDIENDYRALRLKRATELARPGENNEKDFRVADDLLESEKQADIRKLLTPEEYAEYELRSSRTAVSLRYQLELFRPTEEEYKTIFAIQKAFDEKHSDWGVEQMSAQVAAALGSDRAADFLESWQHGGDKVSRLITRLELPARTAGTIRNLQQDLTQRATDIRSNPQLSAEERATQLNRLAQTARAQLSATLGEQGFEAYNDMKGDWIRALQPKATKP